MNVLITGCSSGFGLLSAVAFADRGDQVIATVRDDQGDAAVLAAAERAGVTIDVVHLDVRDPDSVDAGVSAARERHGPIDVLVNNAGVEVFGAVHLAADEEVRDQFDTNVFGVIRMCRAVVPDMITVGSGRIINVGSVAGMVGVPYSGLYAASKHALEALTEAMHFELAQHGIGVSVIEPGQFETALGQKSRVVAAMGPSTPEHQRWQSFRAAQRGLVGGEPADASVVAATIVEAATTSQWRLRWPVGADAEIIIATKSAMPFEEFESAMRTTLDWQE